METNTRRNIGVEAFTADGNRTQKGERAAYYLAGVWTSDGQLIWSSEPTSYDTRKAALDAARKMKGVAR